MLDPLAVAVDCYAGSRGEETPRRFTLENELVEIKAIVDQWRTPDHREVREPSQPGRMGHLEDHHGETSTA